MTSRRRQGKSLKRSVGQRPELRTIVVFTEGKNSEPDYVNGLRRLPHIAENIALNIEIHPEHGVPLTLVQLAAERKKDSEIDECWCIFDVEWPKHHPNLNEAFSLAQKKGVNLAVSNPCFEVWLILHLKEHSRFSDTNSAESLSRSLDKRAGKSIEAATYMPQRRIAAKRAKKLAMRHERDGTRFPNDNPSSGMYAFLYALEGEEDAR